MGLLDGTTLTWLSPPDHPWHRAPWFSWKYINGVNYWEEDRKTGLSEGRTEVLSVTVSRMPDHAAQLELTLAYHPPAGPIVLKEERQIIVSAPDEAGQYRIDWRCSFTAGAKDVLLDRTPIEGEEGGKSWGGYGGLSARLAENVTDFQVLNSEGRRNADAHGQPARWMDLSVDVAPGRAAGIALFDHPENPRHPCPWYVSMNGPKKNNFSTAPLFRKPYTLEAGKNLILRHRVLIHPDRAGQSLLEKEWRAFR